MKTALARKTQFNDKLSKHSQISQTYHFCENSGIRNDVQNKEDWSAFSNYSKNFQTGFDQPSNEQSNCN